MAHVRRQRCALGWLALALLCLPAPAQAWTDTSVSAVRAHLELPSQGPARVMLLIDVRVRGGWISRFDIDGLDPDLVLDPDKPAWVVSDSGEKYVPQVQVRRGGRLRLSFPRRRSAPFRGNYRIGVLYETGAPLEQAALQPSGMLRVGFRLPPWQSGLQQVSIEVSAPPGSSMVVDDTAQHAVEHELIEVPGRTVMRWHRMQLPRTVSWGIEVDVPQAALAGRTPGQAIPRLHSAFPTQERAPALVLALCVIVLSLLKLLDGRTAHQRSLPLVPLGAAARSVCVVGCGLSAALLWPEARAGATGLLCLAALFALPKGSEGLRQPGVRYRAAQTADLKAARLRRIAESWAGAAWLDATTPVGAALLGLCYTPLALQLALDATPEQTLVFALLATGLLLTGTRLQRPLSPAAALLRLRQLQARAAANSELSSRSTELRVGFAARAAVDARLRVAIQYEGLLSLDIVLAQARWLDRMRSASALLAVVYEDSAADRMLAQALPGAQTQCDERGLRAYCLTTPAPLDTLQALLPWFEREPQSIARAA